MDSYEYMAVPVDIFDKHMKFLKDNFSVVTMEEGLRLISDKGNRGVYVSINLDDGYMDNYTHAFPVLKKYGLPATVFLTTDVIGKENLFWWDQVFQAIRHSGEDKAEDLVRGAYKASRINNFLMDKGESEIRGYIKGLKKESQESRKIYTNRMLGWREIKEMRGSGVRFGSHTKTHKNLCLMQDDGVRKELADSRSIIEQALGAEDISFCYPFGKYDDRIKDIVRAEGFSYARTCVRGSNSSGTDRFSLRSIDASFIFNIRLFSSSFSFYSLAR